MAFLARYSGRTLRRLRHDLRNLFQWAADHGLAVLGATRAQLEMYRIVDGGTRSGRLHDRPAALHGVRVLPLRAHRRDHVRPSQYVRRPTVHPTDGGDSTGANSAAFLFTAEKLTTLTPLYAVLLGLNGLRVSEACGANIEDMAFERGHRVLRIIGKGNKPALVPLVPRTARTIDLAIGERRDGPHPARATTGNVSTGEPLTAGCDRSVRGRSSGWCIRHMLRAAFIMAALDAGVPLPGRSSGRRTRQSENDHPS